LFVNPLKPKPKERDRKDMKSKYKEEIKGRSERLYFSRGSKNISLSEGSQATPTRPSDSNNVKVKTLG
jgi:hypothetical protein